MIYRSTIEVINGPHTGEICENKLAPNGYPEEIMLTKHDGSVIAYGQWDTKPPRSSFEVYTYQVRLIKASYPWEYDRLVASYKE